jgi:hypothetical protein
MKGLAQRARYGAPRASAEPEPRVHSRYERTLADLSWDGHAVLLQLREGGQGRVPAPRLSAKHHKSTGLRVGVAATGNEQPEPAPAERGRLIGDFTRWKEHDAYPKALERLLTPEMARFS